ncbi:MAG: SufS family cysteine desulfurase [SAR324 cluster bacterium]|nr:SufS family cysteine desulfurase [SAR324 cluster bacterium]MEC9383564.1 SufS family cysteine desulfurase [SAR324 cluster bacterium]
MQNSPLTAKVRAEFPILKREIHGHPLAYLDNAATTQKPNCVIDALVNFYKKHNSNVSRGVYTLAEEATEIYEDGREIISKYIGAADSGKIIFSSGTTESINLVASAWVQPKLKTGDRIMVTEMEHHSNLVPWQLVAQSCGAELVYWPLNPESGNCSDGRLQLQKLDELLAQSVKLKQKVQLLAVTAVSNVLGTVNPIAEIVKIAHAHGVPVLVDAAQAAARMQIDVSVWDCDFLAFSGHKIYGPTGIGVLYAKNERLEEMQPFQGGGGMIRQVGRQTSTLADAPQKFEAGTPPVAEVSGLAAAVGYLKQFSMPEIQQHELVLTTHALKRFAEFKDLELYGPPETIYRSGVLSFNLQNVHPHDVAQVLDESGISVRAGHHCTQVLHNRLGIAASVRMSLGLYNEISEIDRLFSALDQARDLFLV